jgi:hypothetical protein
MMKKACTAECSFLARVALLQLAVHIIAVRLVTVLRYFSSDTCVVGLAAAPGAKFTAVVSLVFVSHL